MIAAMSSRVLARFVSRRFSSSAKCLSEEEKAAENIYMKHKIEKEKVEKLAHKGPNLEEKPPKAAVVSGSLTDIDCYTVIMFFATGATCYFTDQVVNLKRKQEDKTR